MVKNSGRNVPSTTVVLLCYRTDDKLKYNFILIECKQFKTVPVTVVVVVFVNKVVVAPGVEAVEVLSDAAVIPQ